MNPPPRNLPFLRGSLIMALLTFAAASASAQVVNSWMNPASDPWENPGNWSLGIRPASDQTVAITNSGYKAVGISGATVSGFSDSMTVSHVFISAPDNALSTLFLNYFGTAVPLHVGNGVEIGSNGLLQNSYSSLQVDGAAGGSFLIEDGAKWFRKVGSR